MNIFAKIRAIFEIITKRTPDGYEERLWLYLDEDL